MSTTADSLHIPSETQTTVGNNVPVDTHVSLESYIEITVQQHLTNMGQQLMTHLTNTCTELLKPKSRSEDPPGNRPLDLQAPEDPADAGNRPHKGSAQPEGPASAGDRLGAPSGTGKNRVRVAKLPPSQEEISLFASDSDLDHDDEEPDDSTSCGDVGSDIDQHMMAALCASLVKPSTASDIKTGLAQATKKLWHTVPDKEKIKEKLADITIPANCSYLTVPKTNEEIFTKLTKDIAAQDVRLQQSQKVLATTAMPVLNILNELSSLKAGDVIQASALESLATHASNTLTLLSHQNHRLLQQRKNKIVRTLTPDLKSLRNV